MVLAVFLFVFVVFWYSYKLDVPILFLVSAVTNLAGAVWLFNTDNTDGISFGFFAMILIALSFVQIGQFIKGLY